ncbi:DNA mismatch repair protein MLH1 [Gracilaria domingensis]|nr:DNA mismatch repair protein MLH1 [Gracilaria domingensis]
MDAISHAVASKQHGGHIHKLPQHVINLIAAGEVVVRPSMALKELLENSLDAGASSITVSVKEGGLKLLQVVDNGKDLETVSTFGFRGEALASISHVARLSVVTMTKDSEVAFKASYLNGALKSSPHETAGVQGTSITVEDMFYNLPTRRKALNSSSEEYRAIVDVVTKYSIKYPEVAFVCRRQPKSSSRLSSVADVRTPASSTAEGNIRAGFGSLANETFSANVDVKETNANVYLIATRATFSLKRGVFILFINGRLVECLPFKKAIWGLYSSFLPKNGYPFVYVDLSMDQKDIDVNVHPTKKEVRFLHEVSIVGTVVEALSKELKRAESSRMFPTQTLFCMSSPASQSVLKPAEEEDRVLDSLTHHKTTARHNRNQELMTEPSPGSSKELDKSGRQALYRGVTTPIIEIDGDGREPVNVRAEADLSPRPPAKRRPSQTYLTLQKKTQSSEPKTSSSRLVYAKDKVRTGSDAPVGLYDVFLATQEAKNAAIGIQALRRRRPDAMPLLTSVENLLDKERTESHPGLSLVLREHQFVGVASARFALLQHETKLLLADIRALMKQLVYQQTLIRFADMEAFGLNPPAPIVKLLTSYICTNPESLSTRRINPESCAMILFEKGAMLAEYYGLSMEGDTPQTLTLKTLPLIIPDVMPDLRFLGSFLYHLAADTNWSAEEPCFRSISKAFGEWYGSYWNPMPNISELENPEDFHRMNESPNSGDKTENPLGPEGDCERRNWVIRHVVFAAMRSNYHPPKKFFTERVLREITTTSRLYKVFERC